MADSDDIIVIGHPDQTTSGQYPVASVPSTGGGPSGGGPDRVIRENQNATKNTVTYDDDANDEDIVVVGQRIKDAALGVMNQMTPGRADITLPCVGAVPSQTIRGIAGGLRFKVVSKDFGPGRGGANFATSTSTKIPVEINKDALRGYGALDGGPNYLALHELAHSIKAMRDFNKSQFEAYAKGAGAGLSRDEQIAQYPSSPEFAENEARANSIARELARILNGVKYNFDPPHGYSANCQ